MPSPRALLGSVDKLLRGEFTRKEDLATGRIAVPVSTLLLAGLLLGAIYGAFMGLYAVLRGGDGSIAQLLASTFKVPLLFLLTLAITFPSLYVFSALAGSKMRAPDTLRLLLIALAVDLALLASFGPVTGFFTLSTDSYHFMVLLNVLFFAIAGVVGLSFLSRTLERLFEARKGVRLAGRGGADSSAPLAGFAPPAEGDLPTADLGLSPKRARRIFAAWLVVFSVVGAQMGWILRPFIGDPGMPFTLFRERESSFFEAFFRNLGSLFS